MTDVYDTPEPDLHVPESALWRTEKLFDSDPERDYAARIISAPIVAAELRRIASFHKDSLERVGECPADDWRAYVLNLVVEGLEARADELDGGAS